MEPEFSCIDLEKCKALTSADIRLSARDGEHNTLRGHNPHLLKDHKQTIAGGLAFSPTNQPAYCRASLRLFSCQTGQEAFDTVDGLPAIGRGVTKKGDKRSGREEPVVSFGYPWTFEIDRVNMFVTSGNARVSFQLVVRIDIFFGELQHPETVHCFSRPFKIFTKKASEPGSFSSDSSPPLPPPPLPVLPLLRSPAQKPATATQPQRVFPSVTRHHPYQRSLSPHAQNSLTPQAAPQIPAMAHLSLSSLGSSLSSPQQSSSSPHSSSTQDTLPNMTLSGNSQRSPSIERAAAVMGFENGDDLITKFGELQSIIFEQQGLIDRLQSEVELLRHSIDWEALASIGHANAAANGNKDNNTAVTAPPLSGGDQSGISAEPSTPALLFSQAADIILAAADASSE